MNFIESKRLIEYLDFLLQQGNAGTALEIADKLGVSERTVMSYFKQLSEIKVPVVYDFTRRTWRYSRPGKLVLCFFDDKTNNQNTDSSNFPPPPPYKCAIKHTNYYNPEMTLQGWWLVL